MDDLITDYTALGVKAAEPVPLSGHLLRMGADRVGTGSEKTGN